MVSVVGMVLVMMVMVMMVVPVCDAVHMLCMRAGGRLRLRRDGRQ